MSLISGIDVRTKRVTSIATRLRGKFAEDFGNVVETEAANQLPDDGRYSGRFIRELSPANFLKPPTSEAVLFEPFLARPPADSWAGVPSQLFCPRC